jgi:hypothetical protein
MSGDRPPPRAASWLFRRLCWSANNEAMLGDIQERFAKGRSRLWFWQEVAVAVIAAAYVALFSKRSPIMKRSIVWTVMLGIVFSLGYWTARSPFIVHEEMPSAGEMKELREQYQLASLGERERKKTWRRQQEATLRFFHTMVDEAELDYRRTRSAVSKAKLDNLRHKLRQAQASMKKQ